MWRLSRKWQVEIFDAKKAAWLLEYYYYLIVGILESQIPTPSTPCKVHSSCLTMQHMFYLATDSDSLVNMVEMWNMSPGVLGVHSPSYLRPRYLRLRCVAKLSLSSPPTTPNPSLVGYYIKAWSLATPDIEPRRHQVSWTFPRGHMSLSVKARWVEIESKNYSNKFLALQSICTSTIVSHKLWLQYSSRFNLNSSSN